MMQPDTVRIGATKNVKIRGIINSVVRGGGCSVHWLWWEKNEVLLNHLPSLVPGMLLNGMILDVGVYGRVVQGAVHQS